MKIKMMSLMAVLLFAAFPLSADEVTDQISAGLKAYEEKDFRLALDELKFAIAQIQEKADAENSVLLPEPLEGWQAGEIENVSAGMMMMGGGSSMSRSYTREGESLEIQLVANSPYLNAMMMMINNPMMMGGNPGTKPYRYQRLKGMKQIEGSQTEVTLSVAGQVMIKLTGQNLQDQAVIEQYLDAMDFDAIKAAFL